MSPPRRYWLMKTEPDTFSIDDLERVGVEPWNGVRNYQARNHMRAMRPGDGVFLYHSSCPVPGIAGLATVASEAYPDPTQFDRKSEYYDEKSNREDPRWSLVDVRFERRLIAEPLSKNATASKASTAFPFALSSEPAIIRRSSPSPS